MPQTSTPYSRANPSPRFRELLEQYRAMHRDGDVRRGTPAEQTFDGKSLPRQAARIRKLIARTGARTVLDYGCGKGTQYRPAGIMENGVVRWNSMQEYWSVESIRCYDPGHAPFSTLPEGTFDGVVCTDVLEHCPEEDLPWIVGELFGYARGFVFANVACYRAMKTLPNGENAHCTIRPVEFWRGIFQNAAAAASEKAAGARGDALLWEVWADTLVDNAHREERVANFELAPEAPPPLPSPGRSGLWRMV
jgi:hypothetical protein